jgi:hypothetical protein
MTTPQETPFALALPRLRSVYVPAPTTLDSRQKAESIRTNDEIHRLLGLLFHITNRKPSGHVLNINRFR